MMIIKSPQQLVAKVVSVAVCFSVMFGSVTQAAYASVLPYMSEPGQMVLQSESFDLPRPIAIEFKNNDPFNLRFVFEKGDTPLNEEFLKEQADIVARYFLAALTIPEKDLWVNLSPYEAGRIAPAALAQTDLGKDMLGQDYVLKQLAASLTHPDTIQGKAYWNEVKQGAGFNKVWIVPGKVLVYEEEGRAVIGDAGLRVMCDEDYLVSKKINSSAVDRKANAESFKIHILPLIEKDVNEGKNFARFRQAYSSLILGLWFKKKLRNTILSSVYLDKNKTAGVDTDKALCQKIYDEYVKAFNTGAYKVTQNTRGTGQSIFTANKITKRNYFSGGVNVGSAGKNMESAPISSMPDELASRVNNKAPSAMINVAPTEGERNVLKDEKPFNNPFYILPAHTHVTPSAALKKELISFAAARILFILDKAGQGVSEDEAQRLAKIFVAEVSKRGVHFDSPGRVSKKSPDKQKFFELARNNATWRFLGFELYRRMVDPVNELPPLSQELHTELYGWFFNEIGTIMASTGQAGIDQSKLSNEMLDLMNRHQYSLPDSIQSDWSDKFKWEMMNLLRVAYSRALEACLPYETVSSGVFAVKPEIEAITINSSSSLIVEAGATNAAGRAYSVSVSRMLQRWGDFGREQAISLLKYYLKVDPARVDFLVQYIYAGLFGTPNYWTHYIGDETLTVDSKTGKGLAYKIRPYSSLSIAQAKDDEIHGLIAEAERIGNGTHYSSEFFRSTDPQQRRDLSHIAVSYLVENISQEGMAALRVALSNYIFENTGGVIADSSYVGDGKYMPADDANQLIATVYPHVLKVRKRINDALVRTELQRARDEKTLKLLNGRGVVPRAYGNGGTKFDGAFTKAIVAHHSGRINERNGYIAEACNQLSKEGVLGEAKVNLTAGAQNDEDRGFEDENTVDHLDYDPGQVYGLLDLVSLDTIDDLALRAKITNLKALFSRNYEALKNISGNIRAIIMARALGSVFSREELRAALKDFNLSDGVLETLVSGDVDSMMSAVQNVGGVDLKQLSGDIKAKVTGGGVIIDGQRLIEMLNGADFNGFTPVVTKVAIPQ